MCKYDKLYSYYSEPHKIYKYKKDGHDKLNHVHDYAGRTELAGERLHDHRFSSVTGEGIPVGGGRHVHRYINKTTFDFGHNHRMMGTTGVDISIPGGDHVHSEKSVTSFDHGHRHRVHFTTSGTRRIKRNDCYSSYDCYCDYSY